MSRINITPFFKFSRVKIVDQKVSSDLSVVYVDTVPDGRFTPICHECKEKSKSIHSYDKRAIRDIDIFKAPVYIGYKYRKIRCNKCLGIRVEELDLAYPYERITKRFAQYIIELCQYMTVEHVAEVFNLDKRLVKKLHKEYLISKFREDTFDGLKIICVDEISLKKGHNYLTIVMDYETGRVVHVGKDRSYNTLKAFFKKLPDEVRENIEAVCIDMWDPYIKAISTWCPNASIVFDFFHVVRAYGKVIDKVRNAEYKKASDMSKGIIKGTKYILIKNRENLKKSEADRLNDLLKINRNLTIVYILKDYIKRLWKYKYKAWAKKAINNFVAIAQESGIKPLIAFAKTIVRHAYGIINHCKYHITTSRLEGFNNKIKVIKRKAYGFRDIEYFSLIIKSNSVPVQLICT